MGKLDKATDKVADVAMATPETDQTPYGFRMSSLNAIDTKAPIPSAPTTDHAFDLAAKQHDVGTMRSLIGETTPVPKGYTTQGIHNKK